MNIKLELEAATYSLLDPSPDNSGHLVSVHVDNWVGNLDLLEGSGEASLACCDL